MINKETLKNNVYKAELKITAKIVSTVLNREGKIPAMQKIKKMIRALPNLNDQERHSLILWSSSFYKHTVAGAAKKIDPNDRAEALYSVLKKDTPLLEHVKNDIADSYEHREKHSALVKTLQDGRFYYCTEHEDCAGDHAAYQGRLYYRRSEAYSEEEKEFIHTYGLLAVEDVVLGPVWLTTRRNCRHRLVPISFSRAQTGDYRDVRESEDISYEEEQYRSYKDRRKLLLVMRKTFENSDVNVPTQLKTDLKRTNRLVRAWMIRKNAKKKKS